MNGCKASLAFSPDGGGTELVVQTIDSAHQSIRMQTYSFTEPAIGKALLAAHKRGVDVKVVVDKDHNGKKTTSSVAEFLASNGVPVVVTSYFAIQHNKVIVVDGVTVQTGSFNYSRAASKSNAENVIVLSNCSQLAKPYLQDWQKVWDTGTSLKANY